MKDLISIVVPIFNVEQYLEKCILSIINQTYKNLEIILVDDGSTDNCGEICDKFALMDSRIKVIHKANGGLSDARNEGIKISTGKYIGFVDSDDYIDQDMYSTLYDNMIKSGAQLSVCSRILVVDNVEHFTHYENKYKCFSNREALKDLFIRNEYLCHAAWDKLYSRDLWNDMEFPVGRLFEDAAVMYKIFEKCDKIVSTKKQLYYYVQRKGSISNCAYNEKKVRHQIENRINAINYYKNFYLFSPSLLLSSLLIPNFLSNQSCIFCIKFLL